ncbi:MAG: hypothetical protein JSS76_00720 [Bacteroidetes bacterium]|nr:hypothetical protein [Bacteroidota bacterium]
MKRISDFLAAFIPASAIADAEQARAHRFFIISCFITSLFAGIYCLMSWYIHGLLFAYAMVVSVIVFLAMPFLLRRGLPLYLLENLFVLDIVIVVILLIYWGGGIRVSNLAPWPLVIPSFAMLMQGPARALKWLMVSLGIIVFFSYFTFKGISFPIRYDMDKDPLFNTLSLLGLVLIVTAIFYNSEKQRRGAQYDLKQQNLKLEAMNSEKDNFLRIVSHDLKSPALIVSEFAKYIDDPELTEEERKEYLEHISASGERMLELIRNLLDINVIESGRLSLSEKEFSLNDLISNYSEQIKLLAANSSIQIKIDLPVQDITIVSDKARVEQVIDNYVSNALKYCPDGSRVDIRLNDTPGYVEISVKDNGPGIAARELPTLFEPFRTASSVPRKGMHSSGLGLAIVRKIADVLSATVGGESELGRGSSFYIRFPKK